MLKIEFTNKMKRDLKRMVKRGKDAAVLEKILDLLARKIPLPPKNKDHQLSGEWRDFRECHLENDWLLIYRIFKDKLILSATRTGTHSDLFNN